MDLYISSDMELRTELSIKLGVEANCQPCTEATLNREHLRGKHHCTVDLLFDWFRNARLWWVH